jgi:TolA-binding protein
LAFAAALAKFCFHRRFNLKRLLICLVPFLIFSCTNDEERLKVQRDIANLQEQIYEIERDQAKLRESMQTSVDQINTKVEDRTQVARTKEEIQQIKDQNALFQARIADLETRLNQLSRAAVSISTNPGAGPENPAAEGTDDAAAIPESLSGSEVESQFNQVLLDFNRGKFEVAKFGFQELLNAFPDSPQAEAARYYLGRANFETKSWQEAIEQFDSLRTKHPDGDYVRQAMYYLGAAYYYKNAASRSVLILRELITKYPSTQEAELARQFLIKAGFQN